MAAVDPQLERIARRVKWWEPADNTLADRNDFLCRVMALGLWNDVLYAQRTFGLDAFRLALTACPPGVMDPVSWNFWHLRLGSASVPPFARAELRMKLIEPRLDCLPASQQSLWPRLATVAPDFVLYGGTALALQLGGRISVDFDFFSPSVFGTDELTFRYSFLKGASLLHRAHATATYSVPVGSEDVKISFFGGLDFGRVDIPVKFADNEIHAAGLLDLAAQKAKVVQVRAEAKDYLDLGFLLQHGLTLPRALGAAETLYPGFNASITLKALVYFKDVPTVPAELRRRLIEAVAGVAEIPAVTKQSSSLLP